MAFQDFFDKKGTILSIIDNSITQFILTGDTYNNGNLYVTGNTLLDNLYTTGNTIFNGNLIVTGNTNLYNLSAYTININSNLNVSGITTLDYLYTTGDTIHNGNLIVTGNTTSNNLHITNDIGIGLTTTTASLHIQSGSTVAGSAPIKIESGTTLTIAEKNAIENDGTRLYYTDNLPIRQIFVQSAYGEMYENNGTGTTITSTPAGTFIGWKTSISGNFYLCSFSGNTTANRIVINNGANGDYNISFVASISCSITRVYTISIFKNGVQQTDLTTRIRGAETSTYFSTSITGILKGLISTDYIDVRIAGTNDGDGIVLYNGNLSMNRINR